MPTTKIADLINPTVMADVVSAKLDKAIVVTPFAKIDKNLVGVPGDKIQVPQYAYIGDAVTIAEGEECDTTKLGMTTVTATIKKAMKAVELSDEAVLSTVGNPVGETNNQIAKAIAGKVDSDSLDALCTAQRIKFLAEKISYFGIVDAIDLFQEEVMQPFINIAGHKGIIHYLQSVRCVYSRIALVLEYSNRQSGNIAVVRAFGHKIH